MQIAPGGIPLLPLLLLFTGPVMVDDAVACAVVVVTGGAMGVQQKPKGSSHRRPAFPGGHLEEENTAPSAER